MKRAALIVVLFGIVSLLMIPVYPHFVSPNELGRWALAGALIGVAVCSEYPAAVPALVLLIVAWNRVVKVIAGGLPFAIGLAAYHYISFGSILRLPYGNDQYGAFRKLSRSGIYGIEFPSLLTALKFFFDPGFGLFVLSPVLILAVLALVNAKRKLAPR